MVIPDLIIRQNNYFKFDRHKRFNIDRQISTHKGKLKG